MRLLTLLLLSLFATMPTVLAHSGFNQLSWQESVGAYDITVLEDFHVEEAKAHVLIQVSHGKQAAPEGTRVKAVIHYEGKTLYQDDVTFVGNSSQDGNRFYAAYILDTAIKQEGLYKLELFLSGSLGEASKTYFIQATNESRVSWLEYVPSALILLISLGGILLLFIPLAQRKDSGHEATKIITRAGFPSH